MGKHRNKEGLIDAIRAKHRQLERYLFFFEKDDSGTFVATGRPKFGRDEMLQPGVVDEWSLRDVLAHLIDWERRFIGWYETGLAGEVLETPALGIRWDDVDTMDQEISEELRESSLEAVLAEFPKSYQQIVATVGSICEEELFACGRYGRTGEATLAGYIAVCTYEHYDWAKKQIRRWRQTHAGKYLSKEAVQKRIQVERRRLEKVLTGLTEREMEEAGVIGEWSVKDIVAHLVDWEQRFMGWYEAGLRGEVPETPAPGLTWRDLDILNQRIYERHKHRDLEDVMAQFHSSYEQVLALVRGMPEEEMFEVGRYSWLGEGNLVGYILANTANHYRWAKANIQKRR